MEYPKLNLIVAVDEEMGIGKNGTIPWDCKEDKSFFYKMTKDSILIMGRKTFESIECKLKRRTIYVLSRGVVKMGNNDFKMFSSLFEAISEATKTEKEIYICGGVEVYNEAMSRFPDNLRIIVSRIKGKHDCDVFFDDRYLGTKTDEVTYTTMKAQFYKCKRMYGEEQYLNLAKKILKEGEDKPDRTGTGVISLNGVSMKFDIRYSIPLLTTKRMFYRGIVEELKFFIDGKTNTKELEQKKINIWKPNTSKEFISNRGLNYNEGDMGPMYGWQWRHWGAEYKGCEKDYEGKGTDQIENVIKSIKTDPFSRRHLISCWNVNDIDKMVLPPCHILIQFVVSGNGKYLDSILYQRSGDFFLGIPFNIASYSLLSRYIASKTGLRTRYFTHMIGDAHIYKNHISQMQRQIKRNLFVLPNVNEKFELFDYKCHSRIKAKMAV